VSDDWLKNYKPTGYLFEMQGSGTSGTFRVKEAKEISKKDKPKKVKK
jgi:hypothetical protein